jgi:hypothetical protein
MFGAGMVAIAVASQKKRHGKTMAENRFLAHHFSRKILRAEDALTRPAY